MNKLVVLLVVATFVLSACGGAESRKEKYLQSGNEHFNADDCKKAKLDYKNVIQIDPKTVGALIGLSRCAIDEQEWKSSYQLLHAAIAADENSIDAKVDLAKLYLILGDSEKSYELIEEVLSVDAQNASAIALRGIFHLKNNTLPAARTDADSALQIEPDNTTAVTLYASLKVKDGESSEAVEHIDKLLASNGLTQRNRKEFQVMLISLYSQLEDIDSIIKIYQQLMAQYPDETTYAYRLAALYADNDRVQDAETLLLSNIEDSDDKLAYIAFLDKYKTKEIADKTLVDYASDGDGKLNLALGGRYLRQGDVDAAKGIFEALASEFTQPEHLEAKNELTLLALKNNDSETAKTLLDEVLAEQPGNLRALIVRGSLALAGRDAPAAIADLRTAQRDQPNNTYVIRQLATAYILNDQQDLARKLLQQAVDIDANDKQLSLLYARLQGGEQNFEAAINTVNELLENNEKDLETIKTLFDLQIANKDYVGAKNTAESMKTEMSDSPLGYYLAGVLLQSEDNAEAAEKQYLLALKKQPRANEPLSGLVRLYLTQKQPKKALSLLNDYVKNDPSYLIPYNLKGEVALSMKNYAVAKESFETAIKIGKEWWIPYRGLALVYSAQGDNDNVIKTLQRGFKRSTGTERIGIELALVYYQLGDRTKAIETYQEIINKVPDSALSKNNLAMVLVDDKAGAEDIKQALVYAQELEAFEEAASLDTVGWVNYRAGNTAKAIEILEKAVALSPDAGELRYHLGMAYASEGGNVEKAKQNLQLAVDSAQEYAGKDKAKEQLKSL